MAQLLDWFGMQHTRRELLSLIGSAPFVSLAQNQDLRDLANPAKPGSRLPYLITLPGGGLAMSWVESPANAVREFVTSTLKDGRWSIPETITRDARLMLNWADFPSIVAAKGTLAAHWLERGSTGEGSYQLKIGMPTGLNGKWVTVYDAPTGGSDGYTGFLSFAAYGKRLFATFLHNSPSGTKLRSVEVRPDGTLAKEEVLDGDVCSCCQTSAAVTDSGPIIVYRDHEEGQIRDISYVRFENGAWTKPGTVHRDGWQINACPVNGPSIAAQGKFVAVAWYSAGQNTPRVLMATSRDSGKTFAPPVRVDSGKPIGRVSITLAGPNPTPIVAWLQRQDEQSASIKIRALINERAISHPITLGQVSPGRMSGFPRITVVEESLYAAWTEDRIKTAKLSVRAIIGR